MSAIDYFLGVKTPKLEVPTEFKPTLPDRGWLIYPFNGNPEWSAIVAIIPALLGTILIFMDQQITAVIINRKEFKLTKGCGYHLDLLVLAILIQVCSIMGLPWYEHSIFKKLTVNNVFCLFQVCSSYGSQYQSCQFTKSRV